MSVALRSAVWLYNNARELTIHYPVSTADEGKRNDARITKMRFAGVQEILGIYRSQDRGCRSFTDVTWSFRCYFLACVSLGLPVDTT